jgi:hypothetical protein
MQGLHTYRAAVKLNQQDWPYYALLQAAMLRGDSDNAAKLRGAWPELWAELEARYNAPGGLLDGEEEPP